MSFVDKAAQRLEKEWRFKKSH